MVFSYESEDDDDDYKPSMSVFYPRKNKLEFRRPPPYEINKLIERNIRLSGKTFEVCASTYLFDSVRMELTRRVDQARLPSNTHRPKS